MLKRPQAARLLAVDRDAPGTRLLLLVRGEAAVGTAEDSRLRVADPNAAQRHAIIRYAHGRYYLVDLKSAPGTFINGRRIRRAQRLNHGDVLRFGGAPPYRFIDPDAQKRRRGRRNLRLGTFFAILIGFVSADHFQKWGLVSVATVSKVVAMVEPSPRSKRIEPPIAVPVHAPDKATAPPRHATIGPSPAARPSAIAVVAAPVTASAASAFPAVGRVVIKPSRHAAPASAAPAAISELPAIIAAPSSAAVEATHGISSSGALNWLATLNLYRTALKLQPVEEDPALSQGCRDHAKYLVTNYGSTLAAGINIGSVMHTEDESKPGYTPDGIKAARASDVMFQAPQKFSNDERMTRAIQSWIAGPFHRPQIVNPDVRQVGFGEYCSEKVCAASLDWRSDLEPALPGGHPYATPIEIPPDGATVKPSGFGGEWPSPTSTCPGYPYNAPAITIQVGINMPAAVTDASLTQTTGAAAGTKVATCAYDFQRYTNPDRGTQEHGRKVLRSFGQVVMMVRDPLASGETYRVAMTVNGTPYRWSFTAAP